MSRAQQRVMGELRARGSSVARLCLALTALTVAACSDDVAPLGDDDAGKVDAGYQHAIVEQTIDPVQGGKVELPAGPVLEIPAGALPPGSKVRITVETTQSQGPQGAATRVFQFGPEGLRFEKPVPISIPFDLTGRNAADYTMFWSKLGGDGYDNIPTEFKDGKAMAMVEHFSVGGVRLKPEPVTCPAETSTPRDDDKDSVTDGCTCKEGYVQRSGTCVDINECDANNGGCDSSVTCTNTAGSHVCGKCPTGYTGSGDTKCTDINECEGSSSACDANVKCTNTAGSFTCGDCPAGFTGGGESGCLDIDECAIATACDKLTKCTNTPGGYECAVCPPGYLGNGKAGCTDANECAVLNGGCDMLVTCVNTPGSFSCGDCPNGYEKKTGSQACVDINECVVSNDCGAHVTCTNKPGTRECGECEKGYEKKDGVCVNVDECLDDAKNTCDEAHTVCRDNQGGYECLGCREGWLAPKDETTCNDVNECAEGGSGLSDCTSQGKLCNNTDGSYSCGECATGYKPGSDSTCVGVVTCRANNDNKARQCGGISKLCQDQDHADAVCVDCPTNKTSDGLGGCIGYQLCMDSENAGGKECGRDQKRCVDHDNSKYTCETCPVGETGDGLGACRPVKKCSNSQDAKVCTDAHKTCHDTESADLTCPSCALGYVPTQADPNVCRSVYACTDVVDGKTGTESCAALQCVNHPERDFSCEACAEGKTTDGQGGCRDVSKCDVAKVADCAMLNKACVEHSSSDASCGACREGFKQGASEAVACVAVRACEDNGGAGLERCELETAKCSNNADEDFSCGQCESGEKYVGDACVPFATCASNPNACTGDLPKCVDHADGDYTCVACAAGKVSNGAGGCRDVTTCEAGSDAGTAACATKHEKCVNHPEADYTCGGCEDTYVRNAARECVLKSGFDGCAPGEIREDLCDDENRLCVGGVNVEADCGACEANHMAQGVQCVPTVDPCMSGQAVRTMCDQMHVTCQNGACTTTCQSTYVKNAAGTCVAEAGYDSCAPNEPQALICTPQNRTCMDAETGTGGTCTGCAMHYQEVGGMCVDGCTPGAATRAQCDLTHHVCVPGLPAACSTTECLQYYEPGANNTCEPVDGCADGEAKRLECDGQFKECTGTPGTAPACGDCQEGYIPGAMPADSCVIDPMGCDMAKPIGMRCAAEHRECVDATATEIASCSPTMCVAPYELVGDQCVDACAEGATKEVECSALNRTCTGAPSMPVCDACKDGFDPPVSGDPEDACTAAVPPMM
jgi:hypothetical protein